MVLASLVLAGRVLASLVLAKTGASKSGVSKSGASKYGAFRRNEHLNPFKLSLSQPINQCEDIINCQSSSNLS